MPIDLLKRAQEILDFYETKDQKKTKTEQVSLFDEVETKEVVVKSKVLEELDKINLDNLRPIDALNILYNLKEIQKGEEKDES